MAFGTKKRASTIGARKAAYEVIVRGKGKKEKVSAPVFTAFKGNRINREKVPGPTSSTGGKTILAPRKTSICKNERKKKKKKKEKKKTVVHKGEKRKNNQWERGDHAGEESVSD